MDREKTFRIIDVLLAIGKCRGVSAAQIALSWVRSRPLVTSTIIGAKRPDQLQDNIDSLLVRLSPEELIQLEEVSALTQEYPGWMVARQNQARIANPSR